MLLQVSEAQISYVSAVVLTFVMVHRVKCKTLILHSKVSTNPENPETELSVSYLYSKSHYPSGTPGVLKHSDQTKACFFFFFVTL